MEKKKMNIYLSKDHLNILTSFPGQNRDKIKSLKFMADERELYLLKSKIPKP